MIVLMDFRIHSISMLLVTSCTLSIPRPTQYPAPLSFHHLYQFRYQFSSHLKNCSFPPIFAPFLTHRPFKERQLLITARHSASTLLPTAYCQLPNDYCSTVRNISSNRSPSNASTALLYASTLDLS